MEIDDEFLSNLPTNPGVYVMKDKGGKVIYVGKAVSLRSRVRSYFRDKGDGRFHVPFLRNRVEKIETIITDNEKEALLLENTLIKKHKPRYNIRLRDDKTYISLRFDVNHEWPRIHRTRRRRTGDKALYFGPYSSASAVKETIRFLQRLFPIRSCSDRELTNRSRPCMLYQIERCTAPCVNLADKTEYAEHVKGTLMFLRGQRDEVMKLLRTKMEEHSEALNFEKAAVIRDQIKAMEKTVQEEKVHSHRLFDRDVISFARGGGRVIFATLNFRKGRMENSETFDVKDTNLEAEEIIEGFLSQYYDSIRKVPRDILVGAEPSNRDFLEESLRQQRDGAVSIRMPQRGEKKRLLSMAQQNADATLERILSGARTVAETLENIRKNLNLEHSPRVIHCFDISNFQGSFPVGSMVCFADGEPDKNNYRRFKIRDVKGQNDFAMMREVLTRQYSKVATGDTEPPDLVVIDGGIGQLNIAVEVMRELDLSDEIPVVGMAKSRIKMRPGPQHADDKYRTEERIFLPGRKNPVVFKRSDPALHLLQQLRDETHRFGVTYHRLLRTKSAFKTGLEEIPGVGEKRRKGLLKHFGSLSKIREASVEQLSQAPGIPLKTAETIHAFFHSSPDSSAEGDSIPRD